MAVTVNRNWDSNNDNQIDAANVEEGAGSALMTKGDLESFDTAVTRLPVGTDGQVLTANSATATGLEWAAVGGGSTITGARVRNLSFQTIPTVVPTALIFDTEDYDTESYHDNVTNNTRLTIPEDGFYTVVGQVRWNNTVSTGEKSAIIRVNGSTISIVRDSADGISDQRQQVVLSSQLSSVDFVELFVIQDTGGNLDVDTGNTYISITKH